MKSCHLTYFALAFFIAGCPSKSPRHKRAGGAARPGAGNRRPEKLKSPAPAVEGVIRRLEIFDQSQNKKQKKIPFKELKALVIKKLTGKKSLALRLHQSARDGYAAEIRLAYLMRPKHSPKGHAASAVCEIKLEHLTVRTTLQNLSASAATGASIAIKKDLADDEANRRRKLKDLVAEAAELALSSIDIRFRLNGASCKVLQKALTGTSRTMKDLAIQDIGAQRCRGAVPRLIAFLKGEDVKLSQRAIGALSLIKDRRAVKPLINLTKGRHGLYVNQILFALAAIGGRKAEAFIWSISEGHPQEAVRSTAKAALAELRRNKALGAADGVKKERSSRR